MKSIRIMLATLGLGAVALSGTLAQAHTEVSIGIGLPLLRAPVYYAPPPVYYAPPPVYYPAPRLVHERRVYPQPVYYYGNRWQPRGYGYGYRGYGGNERDAYRGNDRGHDRDAYRGNERGNDRNGYGGHDRDGYRDRDGREGRDDQGQGRRDGGDRGHR